MKGCPPLLIVAVFVPLDGGLIVPLSDPVVVAAVVKRFRTTFPALAFVLFTWRGPVVAPNVPPVPTVNVPALTIVPPVYVFAPVNVSVPVPTLVSPPPTLGVLAKRAAKVGVRFPFRWPASLLRPGRWCTRCRG